MNQYQEHFSFDLEGLKIGGTPLMGQYQIVDKAINCLSGDNGIGKSLLLNYLHQVLETKNQNQSILCWQRPLDPILNYTVQEAFYQFMSLHEKNGYKNEVCNYDSFLSRVNDYGWSDFPASNQKVSQLSGGQNQILKLSLVLETFHPLIYFFDEPFTFLSAHNRAVFANQIQTRLEKNKYMVIVEHGQEYLEQLFTNERGVKLKTFTLEREQVEGKELIRIMGSQQNGN